MDYLYVILEECYCECLNDGDKPRVGIIKIFADESKADKFLEEHKAMCYHKEYINMENVDLK